MKGHDQPSVRKSVFLQALKADEVPGIGVRDDDAVAREGPGRDDPGVCSTSSPSW